MGKFKFFSLLAGLTLAGSPLIAQANTQIAPNPNPSGSTIEVNTLDATDFVSFENDGILNIDLGGKLNNLGTVNSYNIFTNSGTLNNNGALNNSSGGTFNNFNTIEGSGTVNNVGTLNNFGTLQSVSGNLTNSGSLFNSGSLSTGNAYLENIGYIDNSGVIGGQAIDNLGTLNNSNSMGSDVLLNGVNGTINNSGTINGGVDLYNTGALNNSGTLEFGYGRMTNIGTLKNSGKITALFMDNSGTVNNSGTLNSGEMHNSGDMNNSGTITGLGTYTQSAGQTINNGSMTQASIAINGGSLSGTGTIYSDVTIRSGGSINPGNSLGALKINGNFNSCGILEFDIAGTGTGLYDVLGINGNALFTGGNIKFDFISGFNATAGNFWDFMIANTITGWDTLNFNFNGLGDGLVGNFTQLDTGGERLMIKSNADISPVPEPKTYAMLLAGLGLICFTTWRRKQTIAA